MTQAEKENILKYAITIIRSDSEIDIRELAYLKGLSTHLGVSVENLHGLLHKDAVHVTIPQSEVKRMEILIYLVFCIVQDEKIHPEEDKMLHKISLRLGFKPQMIGDIMRSLKGGSIDELSPDFIVSIAKKYLN